MLIDDERACIHEVYNIRTGQTQSQTQTQTGMMIPPRRQQQQQQQQDVSYS